MIYEPESNWLIGYGLTSTPRIGVYVDLGCAHPVNKSLTHFVREAGWRGVAVDANPDYRPDWERARFGDHFEQAILSSQPEARFAFHENSFTSRISPTAADDRPEQWGIQAVMTSATTPLKEILAQHGIGKIDILTVDLEGHEFEVLTTLDFELHQPEVVIVEYVTSGEGIDCRAANLLIEKGYRLIQVFTSNLIFARP